MVFADAQAELRPPAGINGSRQLLSLHDCQRRPGPSARLDFLRSRGSRRRLSKQRAH